jgi:hypothetical protein
MQTCAILQSHSARTRSERSLVRRELARAGNRRLGSGLHGMGLTRFHRQVFYRRRRTSSGEVVCTRTDTQAARQGSYGEMEQTIGKLTMGADKWDVWSRLSVYRWIDRRILDLCTTLPVYLSTYRQAAQTYGSV